MTYREPDPKRLREVQEDAENRAALERLASAGMRRRETLEAERRAAETAQRSRATPARFRQRAWAAPRRLLFVPFWLAVCVAMAIVSGVVALVVTRDLASAVATILVAFIVANVSVLIGLPPFVAYLLYAALWRRRDALALVAWRDALPFPLERFVETLSLDHNLGSLRLVVRYVDEAPEPAVVEGLLGNLVEAGAFSALNVKAGRYAHAIERATLGEMQLGETLSFGADHDRLIAQLDDPPRVTK